MLANFWWAWWHFCFDKASAGSVLLFLIYGVELWAGVLPAILILWGVEAALRAIF